MIDSTRASSVWSSVALVAVRVMMAVTTYIFGTLFVLRLLFLVDNMEITEIDGEHALLVGIICMQNVWFKWRTRDTCESIVVTVSFAEGIVRANGAGDRRPMPWKFGCRSCVAVV